jgi:hypothetical protein
MTRGILVRVELEKRDQAWLVPLAHLAQHPAGALPDQIVLVPN